MTEWVKFQHELHKFSRINTVYILHGKFANARVNLIQLKLYYFYTMTETVKFYHELNKFSRINTVYILHGKFDNARVNIVQLKLYYFYSVTEIDRKSVV